MIGADDLQRQNLDAPASQKTDPQKVRFLRKIKSVSARVPKNVKIYVFWEQKNDERCILKPNRPYPKKRKNLRFLRKMYFVLKRPKVRS